MNFVALDPTKALDNSVAMTEIIISCLDLILVVVWIYTLTRRIGGSTQSMMSSHIFSAVDQCSQIAKHIMTSDLRIMGEDIAAGHVVCIIVKCNNVTGCICVFVHVYFLLGAKYIVGTFLHFS